MTMYFLQKSLGQEFDKAADASAPQHNVAEEGAAVEDVEEEATPAAEERAAAAADTLVQLSPSKQRQATLKQNAAAAAAGTAKQAPKRPTPSKTGADQGCAPPNSL